MLKKFEWRHIPLIIATATALGPLLFLFSNSLKNGKELRSNPMGLLPKEITFDNYVNAWVKGEYAQAFINSFIVCTAVIIMVCIITGLAAYALAKIEFKGSNLVMGLLLLTLSIPVGLFLVPLFFIWKHLNLMDTLHGLVIIYIAVNLPFNIFLLRSFFVGIPNELLDSGRIDGCNEFQVISRILLPIAKPAFFTVALLVGLSSWNEFFFANAFLQSDEIKTVATRYLAFTGRFSSDWSLISAAGVITIFPIILLYTFLQRRFIDGLTEGSLKG